MQPESAKALTPENANLQPENSTKQASATAGQAPSPQQRTLLTGTTVSSGIAIGMAQILNQRTLTTVERCDILPENVQSEIDLLQGAIDGVCADFEAVKAVLSANSHEQIALLEAHIMICRDPKLTANSKEIITQELVPAAWAWEQAVKQVLETFSRIDSPYLRERAEDLRSVAKRVTARILGHASFEAHSQQPAVFFAYDLTPAETLSLDPARIMAIATEMGGKTSHTGILARSLNVPCVVGISNLEDNVSTGDKVIVDALEGFIIVNPSDADLLHYKKLQAEYAAFTASVNINASSPAETEDGFAISIMGNIESPEDAAVLKKLGGEGVGLYRTEFAFLSRQALPTETELFDDYCRVVTEMAPAKVIIRTLDVGADKMLGHRKKIKEENPAMGIRGIRYCLRHQDIFRRQLRAILRAGACGNAAIMFPMISGLKELQLANSIIREVKQELDNEGFEYDRNMPVGTMIELPSAVFTAGSLAKEVDFFSIGTNDLIQYTLGIDRGNRYVAPLYQPLHPAILNAIKHVVDMAQQAGIPVSICGEMASDPYCIPVLMGMGVDVLSMAPQAIPVIKQLIRRSNMMEFKELTRQVFYSATSASTLRQIRQCVYGRYREELTYFKSLIDTGF